MSTTTFPAPSTPRISDELLTAVENGRLVATLVMDGGRPSRHDYEIVEVANRDFRVVVPGVPASITHSFTTIRKAFAFAAEQGGWA